jgi:hypothetical protein
MFLPVERPNTDYSDRRYAKRENNRITLAVRSNTACKEAIFAVVGPVIALNYCIRPVKGPDKLKVDTVLGAIA